MRSLEYNLKKDCTYSKDQLWIVTAKLDKFRYYEGKKYIKVVREEYAQMIDGETPQFTHLLTEKQGKFTNQRVGKHPQNTLDSI